jgi:hypothetical protein
VTADKSRTMNHDEDKNCLNENEFTEDKDKKNRKVVGSKSF